MRTELRAPIAISIFVKNPQATERGRIYFHDIGDDLTREEKLKKIKNFGSIDGIAKVGGWQPIIPGRHWDWLNQCSDDFEKFIPLGNKNKKCRHEIRLFGNFSRGVLTSRDAWCYNSLKSCLSETAIDHGNPFRPRQ